MKIALMGYARAGKDSVAQMIADRLGLVSTLAFGTELKRKFHQMFPDIPAFPKPRDGYEKFGQGMREIDPNIWVKSVDKRSKYIQTHTTWDIVVTDLRQPNEAEWAKANGYTIVYVHADDEIRRERAKGDSEFMYINSSEEFIWMIDRDYTVFNNGTEEELEYEVKLLLHQMGEAK